MLRSSRRSDCKALSHPVSKKCAARLQLESLEKRQLLSIFTVNTTLDIDVCISYPVACTLRGAINAANANPGLDFIQFGIGSGPKTISPLTALPDITDAVILDATTQPGFAGTPLIQLDGSSAPVNANGLRLGGGNSVVRGLVINRFAVNGILIHTRDGNLIAGNWIGTNAAGTAALGNQDGVRIMSSNNTLGGTTAADRNVISGNDFNGVWIDGSDNQLLGNYIGTDKNGTAALGNHFGGVTIRASNTTVGGAAAGAGNLISANGIDGLDVKGDGNQVLGNVIGTDKNGVFALGNVFDGVRLEGNGNTIGGTAVGAGNLVSANMNGVTIDGSDNRVQGNTIGTDKNGIFALGNAFEGVNVSGTNSTVGGTTAAARNVISGNGTGVVLMGSGHLVQGNYIGTNAAGTAALGNVFEGVLLLGPNNTVGGTTAGARNVISGNRHGGVAMGGNDNRVQGNYIGTNAAGTAALGNGDTGVLIASARNLIGGTEARAGNVISGNDGIGVFIDGATQNRLEGNFIGTAADGSTPLSNRWEGVWIQLGASANVVGGTASGAGNVIAYNGISRDALGGVRVASGTGNAVLGNDIHDNSGLGIDLGIEGITPNDDGDPDLGANQLQNYPVLTEVAPFGSGTLFTGTLNSTANRLFHIEVFANPSCDPSGHGEGRWFLGAGAATTDGSGNAAFSFALRLPLPDIVTATATDADGNTSEFSACKQVSSSSADATQSGQEQGGFFTAENLGDRAAARTEGMPGNGLSASGPRDTRGHRVPADSGSGVSRLMATAPRSSRLGPGTGARPAPLDRAALDQVFASAVPALGEAAA